MNVYERNQRGLIKSLLARPEEIKTVASIIEVSDIEDTLLQSVYTAMIDLHLENKEVNIAAIALAIQEENKSAIDPKFLFELEENVVDVVAKASPEQWAHLTKQESSRTKAVRLLSESMEEVRDPENIPLSVIQNISNQIEELEKKSMIANKRTIKEIAEDFSSENSRLQREGITQHRVLSPYPSIDYHTGGWGPQQLITVGARTGIGKTVFAVNCATAAMEADESVLMFALEMSEDEMMSRMIASLARLEVGKVEKGEKLTDEEQVRFNEALEFIANSKLTLETDSEWTLESIKAKAIEVAQSEKGLDFIIIDYLQLMTVARPGRKTRQEIVAEISRGVKKLAKELDIPIMVLVQLNHRVEDENQLPTKAEIRESGAIAQDSNVIILIHRDKHEDAQVDPRAKFIIDKNRQGREGVYLDIRCALESSLFIDTRERYIPEDTQDQSMPNFDEDPMNNYVDYDNSNSFNAESYVEDEFNLAESEINFFNEEGDDFDL